MRKLRLKRFMILLTVLSLLVSLMPNAVLADDLTVNNDAVVYKHTNAPGQYTNEAIGLNKDATLEATDSIVSLGAYGGNISWKFSEPIKNDDKKPLWGGFHFIWQCFFGKQ